MEAVAAGSEATYTSDDASAASAASFAPSHDGSSMRPSKYRQTFGIIVNTVMGAGLWWFVVRKWRG